ncbi:hypothetical protein GCM10009535_41170 [Streptomyces thermocarboxydovorans]|uniref:TetR family transcriptional regulator n=1 Tax=Streptomyces thermocarboxydovorans TaxID=59298 RepID=A0ABN1HLB8_9ACTN
MADAMRRGEIIEDGPARLTLVTGAGLHGLASLAAGMLAPEEALDSIGELVHHMLYGIKPR